ncbi:MAG: DNA-binding protein WhiA [Clostridia bacterium]|nr:DNA-binding protein WhiA [Clostridia bacterium]
MSFSDDLKKELLQISAKSATCCKKAFFYGLLLSAAVENERISLTLSHKETAELFEETARQQGAKNIVIEKSARFGRELYSISFASRTIAEKLALMCEDSSDRVKDIVGFRCDSCPYFYLRGAFISCATVSDPKTSYHLEFTVKEVQAAKKFYSFLSSVGYQPKTANRRGGIGLYFKKSENIEDIIGLMGAASFTFECMNDKLMRELKNDINRRANCETSNLSKAVAAAQALISDIEKIENAGLLEALPDDLRETAKIRVENPEASLSEMCGYFNPTLSKSGLNHRIQKIKEIARKIEGK